MSAFNFKPINELCTVSPPKKEVKDKVPEEHEVSFIPMNELGVCKKEIIHNETKLLKQVYSGYTYFAENDVLLAKITPCFENGKLGIARNLKNGIGFGSSEYIVFRANKNLDPEFLFYYLSQDSFRQSGSQVMTGAVGHKRIPKDFINELKIPCPPLPEQKRIVAILDEAFTGIDQAITNTEQNLANAKALFDSYLNEVFTPTASPLVKLADITISISDGDHAPPPKAPEGIPFITISNIDKNNRKVDFSNTFKVSKSYYDDLKDHRKPKSGDILYTVTGSFGIPVYISENTEFCFQRHIGLIRPKPEINSNWLYYALMSPMVYQQANKQATGTAQKTVSLKVLRNMKVPLATKKKQQEITEKLDFLWDQAYKLTNQYQQKLAALTELKQSLLHKAFTGELTAEWRQQQAA